MAYRLHRASRALRLLIALLVAGAVGLVLPLLLGLGLYRLVSWLSGGDLGFPASP